MHFLNNGQDKSPDELFEIFVYLLANWLTCTILHVFHLSSVSESDILCLK